MRTVDVVVKSPDNELSLRARQVCGMFDCPPEDRLRKSWKFQIDIDEKPWNVGLIVGPSGSGKSLCAKHLWPDEHDVTFDWNQPTVIDSFGKKHKIENIAKVLNSVGFSTIPAWLRPYGVLSNGEKFRADIARRLIECKGTIVVDEFTSVVDRQVARIASHAVQKYIRRQDKQFVAVSCHEDIIDWLQPDWIIEPAMQSFRWRLVQQRPKISVRMARLPNEAWSLFAPYHYMNSSLHKAASCFGLWVDGTLAAFTSYMYMPHPQVKNVYRINRTVTLPDYQGIGLGSVLVETLAAAIAGVGGRLRGYPSHPGYVASYSKNKYWKEKKKAGIHSNRPLTSTATTVQSCRPCGVFEYIGPAMQTSQAIRFLELKPEQVERIFARNNHRVSI